MGVLVKFPKEHRGEKLWFELGSVYAGAVRSGLYSGREPIKKWLISRQRLSLCWGVTPQALISVRNKQWLHDPIMVGRLAAYDLRLVSVSNSSWVQLLMAEDWYNGRVTTDQGFVRAMKGVVTLVGYHFGIHCRKLALQRNHPKVTPEFAPANWAKFLRQLRILSR